MSKMCKYALFDLESLKPIAAEMCDSCTPNKAQLKSRIQTGELCSVSCLRIKKSRYSDDSGGCVGVWVPQLV